MTKTGICLAALGMILGSAALAEGPAPAFTVISPVFSQLVTFSMPSSFVVIDENTNGPSYIREAVLKGESADRWTQMITVTGAKGLVANPKVSPETFAASIAGGFRSACPETFTVKAVGPTRFGDQEAFVAVASCGSVESSADKHGETAVVVAVKAQRRLLHAAMGRTRARFGQGRHRRGQMAGAAAPVAADPPLSDRAGRICALPELRWQGLAAAPAKASPPLTVRQPVLLITPPPPAWRRDSPPWCAIGIAA